MTLHLPRQPNEKPGVTQATASLSPTQLSPHSVGPTSSLPEAHPCPPALAAFASAGTPLPTLLHTGLCQLLTARLAPSGPPPHRAARSSTHAPAGIP